ncbi:NAD(P)-binding domain-containing protein [Bradyrhizobium sp.]
MRLGFIGTGAITEAMVRGLCGPGRYHNPIFITERTKNRSLLLASTFQNVITISSAQTVIDRSDLVILAVRPDQVRELTSSLRFRPEHRVISLIAGLKLDSLRSMLAPATALHRAIPMLPIESGLGPIPLYPPDDVLEALLGRVGRPILVENEDEFHVIACGSALMATFFEFIATTALWLQQHDVPPKEAARYATSLFHALSAMTLDKDSGSLQDMSVECLTKGGLNEQVLLQLRQRDWFTSLHDVLGGVLTRLSQ